VRSVEAKEMEVEDDDDEELSELESEDDDAGGTTANGEQAAEGEEEDVQEDDEDDEGDESENATPATGSRASLPDAGKMTKRQRSRLDQVMGEDFLQLHMGALRLILGQANKYIQSTHSIT